MKRVKRPVIWTGKPIPLGVGRSRGEKASSSSKLKNEDVIIIKKLLKNWKIGDDVKIAKKFNVNRETIRAIRLNKAWKHIIIENDDENK